MKQILFFLFFISFSTLAQNINTIDSQSLLNDLEVYCQVMSSDIESSSVDLTSYLRSFKKFQVCVDSPNASTKQLNKYKRLGAEVAVIADRTDFSKKELVRFVEKGMKVIVYNDDGKYNSKDLKYFQRRGITVQLSISQTQLSRRDIIKLAKTGHHLKIDANNSVFNFRQLKDIMNYPNVKVFLNMNQTLFRKRQIKELESLGAQVYLK